MMTEAVFSLEGAALVDGGAPLLGELDLTIAEHTVTVIVGAAGSGKSLLLRALSGRGLPEGVRLAGTWLCRRRERSHWNTADIAVCDHEAGRRSGWQSTFDGAASVVLLDEPCTAFGDELEELAQVLEAERARRTIVVATRHLEVARQLAEHVVLLHRNRVACAVPATRFFSAVLEACSPPQRTGGGLVGEMLGDRYRIEHLVAQGGCCTVFKAMHVRLGRPVAIKVLNPQLVEDHEAVKRFRAEASHAGRLHHPNVIGAIDVGIHEGRDYLVMDWSEGTDLAKVLEGGPVAEQRVIDLTRQILDGLDYAHWHGLVHRDLKPENVVIEALPGGIEVARIVDFGIAIASPNVGDGRDRLTRAGIVIGTPQYMAPEQALDQPFDERVDLFALGLIVYEMLAGVPPFEGGALEVARANLLLDPPPIALRVPEVVVDPLLEAFAMLLMAKQPDQRPPTANAARVLLDLIERDREHAAMLLGLGGVATPIEDADSAAITLPPPLIESGPISITSAPPSRAARRSLRGARYQRMTSKGG